MFVIGYVGLLFGRLIKAAVSRQREYLADASAVQFTRNPLGICGALKKIGGLAGHSYVRVPTAETASHMFFEARFSAVDIVRLRPIRPWWIVCERSMRSSMDTFPRSNRLSATPSR